MLKITGLNPSVLELVVDKDSIVNGVNNSEIDRAKVGIKTAKSKS